VLIVSKTSLLSSIEASFRYQAWVQAKFLALEEDRYKSFEENNIL
jgi:hypothetical protein